MTSGVHGGDDRAVKDDFQFSIKCNAGQIARPVFQNNNLPKRLRKRGLWEQNRLDPQTGLPKKNNVPPSRDFRGFKTHGHKTIIHKRILTSSQRTKDDPF